MATQEETQFKYNSILPSDSSLEWSYKHIYGFWPELSQHKDKIHIIYAGFNYSYSILNRSDESLILEIDEKINEGKTNFIFECLSEGFYDDLVFRLNNLADKYDSVNFYLAMSDVQGDRTYDKFCEKNKIKRKLKLLLASSFEKYFQHYTGFTKDYNTGLKEKKFLCFNKVPRQHRITLLSKLLELNLVKDSYYSFDSTQDGFNINDLSDDFMPLKNFNNNLPLKLNMTIERSNPVDIRLDDLEYFNNSYFSIVTETMFYDLNKRVPGNSYVHVPNISAGCFFSEKIFKCLALNHPFIVVSTPFYLYNLQKRGYKTFSPYIDESYDTIEDDDLRMECIVREINRLCNLSEQELINFTYNIQPIVQHNSSLYKNVTDFTVTKNVVSSLK
jgi:hypothetical protein